MVDDIGKNKLFILVDFGIQDMASSSLKPKAIAECPEYRAYGRLVTHRVLPSIITLTLLMLGSTGASCGHIETFFTYSVHASVMLHV